MRLLVVFVLVALLALGAGCAGEGDDAAQPATTAAETTAPAETDEPAETEPAEPGELAFTESEIAEGEPIDELYTCDGDFVSPALNWAGIPEEAAELVLVVEDPDAPGGTYTHWLVYAMAPDMDGLPRGTPPGPVVSGALSIRQGINDDDFPGYTAPCPPEGEEHRYAFTLYALEEETGLGPGASEDEIRAAVEESAVAEATLTAVYQRP
ncbi:MAG TPA: YbhB/YbcL family Raf kinase inhibitor-like protein [Gaiellaceae bacterium]|nr:YbhB/YbcL family Raf kinase inhibitor-like protein [Gaiellaceae bacterium]